MGLLVAQHLEGPGQQGVAGQDRRRLVEFLVAGRLPAPQVVVVHGRQIIMDQRIAVHHLDRRRDPHRAALGHVEQARAGRHQEWADPLAASQGGIPHGLDQPRLRPVIHDQQAIEHSLDRLRIIRQCLLKIRQGSPQSISVGSVDTSPFELSTIFSTRA